MRISLPIHCRQSMKTNVERHECLSLELYGKCRDLFTFLVNLHLTPITEIDILNVIAFHRCCVSLLHAISVLSYNSLPYPIERSHLGPIRVDKHLSFKVDRCFELIPHSYGHVYLSLPVCVCVFVSFVRTVL
jgi:hypothetical protein